MSRSRRLSGIVAVCALLVAPPAARAAVSPVGSAKGTAPKPPTVPVDSAPATFETDPVAGEKDAADDMAIGVNPWDRTRSRVIGTDKAADALEVYDLAGHRL